jgi:hypothetical protein
MLGFERKTIMSMPKLRFRTTGIPTYIHTTYNIHGYSSVALTHSLVSPPSLSPQPGHMIRPPLQTEIPTMDVHRSHSPLWPRHGWHVQTPFGFLKKSKSPPHSRVSDEG